MGWMSQGVVAPAYLLVVLLGASTFGCGGDDSTPPSDAIPGVADGADGAVGPDPDGGESATCSEVGAVGTPCVPGGCGDGHRCYEGADASFCIPDRDGCAGIAGAECEDPGHDCVIPPGDSGGVCLTPAETACVCDRSPGALNEC